MDLGFYRTSLNRYGIGATLYHAAYRAAQRVAPVAVWNALEITLDRVEGSIRDDPGRADGRLVDAESMRPYARDAAAKLTDRFIDEAAARGDRCFAFFDAGRLTSYGWYSTRPVRLTELDGNLVLKFDPQYAYMHNGYTLPAYRGRRLHAIGMAAALEAHAQQGLSGLVSYVDSANFASLRSCYRLGYHEFGHVVVLKLGRRYACSATPGCARYGFRVAPTAS